VSVPLYMDEHVPAPITDGLRSRGVDVLTVQEDGRAGADDEAVLARATALGRVLFTRDEDLLAIASAWQSRGRVFSGVIYAHQLRVPIGGCIRDLHLIATASDPREYASRVEYLPL